MKSALQGRWGKQGAPQERAASDAERDTAHAGSHGEPDGWRAAPFGVAVLGAVHSRHQRVAHGAAPPALHNARRGRRLAQVARRREEVAGSPRSLVGLVAARVLAEGGCLHGRGRVLHERDERRPLRAERDVERLVARGARRQGDLRRRFGQRGEQIHVLSEPVPARVRSNNSRVSQGAIPTHETGGCNCRERNQQASLVGDDALVRQAGHVDDHWRASGELKILLASACGKTAMSHANGYA